MLSFSLYLRERLDYNFLEASRKRANEVFDAILHRFHVKGEQSDANASLAATRILPKKYFPNCIYFFVKSLDVSDEIKSRFGNILIMFIPITYLNPNGIQKIGDYEGFALGGYGPPRFAGLVPKILSWFKRGQAVIIIPRPLPQSVPSAKTGKDVLTFLSNMRRSDFLHEWTHAEQFERYGPPSPNSMQSMADHYNQHVEIEAHTQQILHDLDLAFDRAEFESSVLYPTFTKFGPFIEHPFDTPQDLFRTLLNWHPEFKDFVSFLTPENRLSVLRVVYDYYKKNLYQRHFKLSKTAMKKAVSVQKNVERMRQMDREAMTSALQQLSDRNAR